MHPDTVSPGDAVMRLALFVEISSMMQKFGQVWIWTVRFDCVEGLFPNDRRELNDKIRTFDWGHLGGLAEESDFADVVTLTDDSRDFPC
jgi:hypothetical protein